MGSSQEDGGGPTESENHKCAIILLSCFIFILLFSLKVAFRKKFNSIDIKCNCRVGFTAVVVAFLIGGFLVSRLWIRHTYVRILA